MHGQGRTALTAAGLVGTGAAGAVLALGGAATVGAFDARTTTVRELRGAVPAPSRLRPAAAGALTIGEIYERAKSGVVQVTATTRAASPGSLAIRTTRREDAHASGFVIDTDGYVVTTSRVVSGAVDVTVSFTGRDRVQAHVVGVDPATDLAVVQVAVEPSALTPLPLGESAGLAVGHAVVAIANPLGLHRTATAGNVSALPRPVGSDGARFAGLIELDSELDGGSSGGPLLDTHGLVVGVTTSARPGAAVPVETVKDVAADLISGGRVERAFLGVDVRPLDPRLARLFHMTLAHGLVVERVAPGSPADEAGLRGGTTRVVVGGESYLLGGDVIERLDGRALSTFDQLRDALQQREPGDRVELDIRRGDEEEEIQIKLGRQPPSPG